MLMPEEWAFLVCDCRCCGDTLDSTRKHHTSLFVVWLQKCGMDKEYIIFKEDGLFGAKNQREEIIILPQYIEMQPFNCGLSLVRNHHYQYAYIDINNKPVIPFGKYTWCDPQFTCGFARVMKYHYLGETNKWGIIDTLGNIVVPLKYDKIWAMKEEFLFSLKAFLDDKEERINLHRLGYKVIFDGLNYICTYSIKAFKELVHCEKLYVKIHPNTRQLFFTYGANMGLISLKGIPKEPVISIVANSSGKVFPLLMEKSDIGKITLSPEKAVFTGLISRATVRKTYFSDYESDEINDTDIWSDSYGDEQAYYDGWSREEIESGLADAFEGEKSNYWNID